jgi:hypothetical protein
MSRDMSELTAGGLFMQLFVAAAERHTQFVF